MSKEISIIDKINVHEDDVHCGECAHCSLEFVWRQVTGHCAKYKTSLENNINLEEQYYLYGSGEIKEMPMELIANNMKRCAACLDSEKELKRIDGLREEHWLELKFKNNVLAEKNEEIKSLKRKLFETEECYEVVIENIGGNPAQHKKRQDSMAKLHMEAKEFRHKHPELYNDEEER